MLFRSIHTSVISGKWDTTVGCWLYIITHIDFHTSQNHFSTQLFNSISVQGALNTHTNHMHMLTFVDLAAVILDSLCLIRAVRTAFLKWLHRYPWLNRDLIFEINIWSFSFVLSLNCTLSEYRGFCCIVVILINFLFMNDVIEYYWTLSVMLARTLILYI